MENTQYSPLARPQGIVLALGERAPFGAGDKVRVLTRSPIWHYRVPIYVRDKRGTVISVVEPAQLDNEREGFGLNAGSKLHYFRVAFPLTELWPDYQGAPNDNLRIEIYETWLEKV